MTRGYLVLAALALLLLPSGCILRKPWVDDTFSAKTPADLPPLRGEPALRILVIGDFGTGKAGQLETARAIENLYAQTPPDLVLTVGDNFYPEGVESVDDPLWQSIFEDVYSGDFWDSLLFFPSLGNHDVQGNAQALIEYSDRSPKWTMPAEYYTFRRPLPSGDTVRFLALNTNEIKAVGSTEALNQMEWVDSVLGSSVDEFVIAYGHHPIQTAGWHEPNKSVHDGLLSAFQGRVPLYLAGHNHSTELLRVSDNLLQAVCGGGAGRDNAYRVGSLPETLSAFSNGGWCFLQVFQDTLAIELYNRAGTLRYRHLIEPPPSPW